MLYGASNLSRIVLVPDGNMVHHETPDNYISIIKLFIREIHSGITNTNFIGLKI